MLKKYELINKCGCFELVILRNKWLYLQSVHMAYGSKYSGLKYKCKYFKLVLEYNLSTSTCTKYYMAAVKGCGILCSSP